MKKYFLIVLVAFGLAACSQKEQTNKSEDVINSVLILKLNEINDSVAKSYGVDIAEYEETSRMISEIDEDDIDDITKDLGMLISRVFTDENINKDSLMQAMNGMKIMKKEALLERVKNLPEGKDSLEFVGTEYEKMLDMTLQCDSLIDKELASNSKEDKISDEVANLYMAATLCCAENGSLDDIKKVSNLYSEAVKSSDELSQSTKQQLFVTFIIGEHSYKYWAGKELKD